MYVDNVSTSFGDENLLMEFNKTSSGVLLAEAGFNLRSWNSNNKKLCQKANEEGVLDGGNGVKIFLGLRWDPKTDRFSLSRLDLGIDRKFKSKR